MLFALYVLPISSLCLVCSFITPNIKGYKDTYNTVLFLTRETDPIRKPSVLQETWY